jgi:hypothetical protein
MQQGERVWAPGWLASSSGSGGSSAMGCVHKRWADLGTAWRYVVVIGIIFVVIVIIIIPVLHILCCPSTGATFPCHHCCMYLFVDHTCAKKSIAYTEIMTTIRRLCGRWLRRFSNRLNQTGPLCLPCHFSLQLSAD